MAMGRVIMGVAGLALAGLAQAAPPGAVRLPLSLASLGNGPEISYQPHRWLTIRRNLAAARSDVFREEPSVTAPPAPLRKVEAVTGDVHPFGDGLRLLVGFRQEKNRRLLRTSGDAADIATARYMPMAAIGIAGEISPGFSIAADMGFLGRSFAYEGGVQLVTPIEQVNGRRGDGVRPLAQVSANYRF